MWGCNESGFQAEDLLQSTEEGKAWVQLPVTVMQKMWERRPHRGTPAGLGGIFLFVEWVVGSHEEFWIGSGKDLWGRLIDSIRVILEISLAQLLTLQLGSRRGSDVSRLQCEFGSQLGSPDGQFPLLATKTLWVRINLQPYNLDPKNLVPSYSKGLESGKIKQFDGYLKYRRFIWQKIYFKSFLYKVALSNRNEIRIKNFLVAILKKVIKWWD